MKIRSSNHAGQQGSVMMVTLMTAGVIGVTLASYLVMTQNQNVSVFRSQTWNNSIAVTEAGIEDGLQLINTFAGSFDDLTKWTNNALVDSWDNTNAVNIYHIQRTIGTAKYDVFVTNSATPTVTAFSTMPWDFYYTSASASTPMFAAALITPAQTITMGRKVAVRTKLDPLFNVAMAALGQIDLKGNDITTDSFDSCDPNYNDGSGGYPVGNLSKTKANGDICTDGVITDTLHVGNANIKGVVKTGPGQNTIGVGPNGSVGDRAWVEGGSSGIQTGHSATDFNVLFPSVTLPPTTWNLKVANNVTTNGTTYKYYFATGGDYWINNLGNNDNVYIATGANVRLKITGNVNPSGQFVIRIAPDNATLQIFEAGSQFNLGGQAMVDNMSGHADRFILYGLPNCTSISLAGNANFYGCIYAPQAAFTLGGGGSTTYDFVGSSVTGSVTMNGHFNFHYDECLRQKTPARGYIPTRWEETSNN